MANLDRENMTEDVKKRFDALTENEQEIVEVIVEAWDYSIEEALDVVETGDYEIYPKITSMADMAYDLVQRGVYGDLEVIGELVDCIDYEKLGEVLRLKDYAETSQGVLRIF